MDRLRLHSLLTRLNKSAKMVASMGETIVQVSTKPSIVAVIGGVTKVFGTILEHKPMTSIPKEWETVMLPAYVPDLIDRHADPTVKGLYNLPDQRVFDNMGNLYIFRVEKDKKSFEKFVADLMWEHWGTEIRLYTDPEGISRMGKEVPLELHSSPHTEMMWGKLEPCMVAEIARAILLEGPPGTGKSTAARLLASRVGARHIRIGELRFDTSSQNIVKLLRPDTLIIDDFDRLKEEQVQSVLTFLEFIRSWVRLIIVTSNHMEKLDPAILRPGRFDEIFSVQSLGDDHARQQLPDGLWERLTLEQQQAVLSWPMAFLKELVLRFKHRKVFDVQTEFLELSLRIKQNTRDPLFEKILQVQGS